MTKAINNLEYKFSKFINKKLYQTKRQKASRLNDYYLTQR